MKTSKVGKHVVHGEFLRGEGGTLIVLAHGWNATGATMRSMSEQAGTLAGGADRFIAELDSGFFSFAKPLQIARRLALDIARLDREHGYSRIIIVGHSAGALIARAAWLRAAGARERGDVGRRLYPWADKVERIVLMAAINRGWSDSVAISPGQKLLFGALALWEFFTYGLLQRWVGTTGYILEMRRGAPFITGLRLKWMAMARHRKEMPLVVQVLGTIDDIVSPKDNVDLSAGKNFTYLEAPKSGHASMIQLDDQVAGEGRRRVFGLALIGDQAALKAEDKAEDVADNLSDGLDDFDEELSDGAGKRGEVTRVVFVIHGIRDYGFWTKKIAGRAKKLGGGATECRTVTSSYGFFPMGPFVFKALRRRRVEWLMDQYVRARALYPKAVFSYMGHSNGTALLAGAMTLSPAIRFDRLVFAGSVVGGTSAGKPSSTEGRWMA
jgi:pimeloyl-ACP methyl ester carboxylesterase